MLVHNLYKPFEIEYLEIETCPVNEHRHTFFELIYTFFGKGVQHVNQQTLNYYPDNMFLLFPQDVQHFICTEKTGFLFIRFNEVYLTSQKPRDDRGGLGDWAAKMEYIFHNTPHLPGCILREQADKPLVRALLEAIRRESAEDRSLHREVLQQLINTLLTIVARNISLLGQEERQGRGQDLVGYIHQHIYDPERLKAGALAAHFHISLNYISEYFKKQTGESLQQYITRYKLKLVETRLQYSDLRINEIVSELGFTDESHLNRLFKKYRGMSPSAFRRQIHEHAI
ncbi:AraC family transcriptional regulator [Dinghuibacter silviterrae]|uniref:Helix-turn-helix protein n=1 Tax=Dinghuibacter silviterrae TaxID=1539049 RepID=A0A4R8DFQ3_9BACT|nr:AraC family transcriptional regulator [Dinghuibacter silviterrae]TDW96168.1 helix-turn-helix protein [Dinghuibacter silviterrae]